MRIADHNQSRCRNDATPRQCAVVRFIYFMFFSSFLKVAPEEKKLPGTKAKYAPEKSGKVDQSANRLFKHLI